MTAAPVQRRPSGARRWTPPWRRPEDPQALAEHLRVIYQDYVFNSPIAIFISLYLYYARPGQPDWLFLEIWLVLWLLYLLGRFTAGLVHARLKVGVGPTLQLWAKGAVLSQGLDGLFVSLLALFIYPALDPMAQVAVLAAALVMVGATAFSLSGRWISVAVYAPGVYLSFAWSTWHQSHDYARGLAVFTLAMFGLYMIYAANQRKSVRKGFELARLNGELANELQGKNAELQEVALARSRLLATVSHDLRQPAHAIGLLAGRALADSSPQSLQQNLRNLDELSQSLSASLMTLMDLTRLDAGLVRANLGSVPLAQVLLRLEAEFAATARNRGLRLSVPSSTLWVHTDPVLLHGVLANLVSNAIKYTRAGEVAVELAVGGPALTLSVRDTGPGIPAEKMDLVFKEFVRLEGSESGTEGLGLGLSIVRRYAALMNHPLSVQSVPGQGTCFSIVLPLVGAPAAAMVAPPRAAPEDVRLAGLRVLVVDNVDLVLGSMVRTLAAWGCQVHSAHCLAEARTVAERHRLDLLISDFHLGDEEPDGLTLITTLRALAGPTDIPALLMTGDVSASLEAEATRCRVGILHKPVRPAVLQDRLLSLLQAATVRVPAPGGPRVGV